MSATTMKLLQHKAYGDPTLGSTLVPIVIFQNPDVAQPPQAGTLYMTCRWPYALTVLPPTHNAHI
jgi:hypothetical protein